MIAPSVERATIDEQKDDQKEMLSDARRRPDDRRRTGRPIHKPARVAQPRRVLDHSNYRAYRFIRSLNHASTSSARFSARIAYGPIFTPPTTNRRVRIMTIGHSLPPAQAGLLDRPLDSGRWRAGEGGASSADVRTGH
uniref:Uncharacterized protein n=1 Tax=Plectus sambesii TaxID=2011161 RepID=A0A914UZ84_9BILA